MGGDEPQTLKGMHYNAQLCRWEGNENVLAPFDVPVTNNPAISVFSTPKPALIANVGSTKGVQVVGGMVFDPVKMTWLKLGPNGQERGRSESGSMSLATEDDDDPFAGLEDLEDERTARGQPGTDDGAWGFGEEFDVGPAFVRRQNAEEDKCRQKLAGWKGYEALGPVDRWQIRGWVGAVEGVRTA